MNHQLCLRIQETLNNTILHIEDSSVYNNNLEVTCKRLEITLPGFLKPVFIEDASLEKHFNVILDAQALGIQLNGSTEPCFLPDGIYIVKYSVSPNDIVYVEYNHLRTTKLLNMYHKALCSVELNDAEPNKDTMSKLTLLQEIKAYIDAAKVQVEIGHNPNKGIQLYNYAEKLLKKFKCIGGC